MPVKKLKEFLDNNKIQYEIITHSPSYTAQETAASAHISGKNMVKTVMLNIDKKMSMAVLSAPAKVDFELLRKASGANTVDLSSEDEFKNKFPGCDIGAMPPFGNLYGMDVYMDAKLSDNEEIVFNAGTHTELMRVTLEDYRHLVKPKIAHISST